MIPKSNGWPLATSLVLVLLAATNPVHSQKASPPEALIKNGSFETWVPINELIPEILNSPNVQDLKFGLEGTLPQYWEAGNSPYPEAYEVKRTCTMEPDGKVVHSGEFSVRLHNESETDITYVRYFPGRFVNGSTFQLKSRHRYLLTWWVKGEDVHFGAEGSGPIMMMYYVVKDEDGQARRINMCLPVSKQDLGTGTFDWQKHTFRFDTSQALPDAETVEGTFSFQLRRASGTVWYDDITLEDLGPIVKVEQF